MIKGQVWIMIIVFIGCGTTHQTHFNQVNGLTPPPSTQSTATPTSQDVLQAIRDARHDAQFDSQQNTTGFCLGADCLFNLRLKRCCGLLGVGASYVYRGGVPSHRLVMLECKYIRLCLYGRIC